MGFLDALTAGFMAPAGLVLVLGRIFRIAGGRLSYLMLLGGAGCVLVAIAAEFLAEPGAGLIGRHWRDQKIALLIDALIVATIEELLKVGIMYRLLTKADGMSWRRFAILSAWTGVGFAAAENWTYVARYGGDVMILRSFTASWVHVLNAIVAARLLWLGAQEGARDMTIAAFCLSIVLHAAYNYLVSIYQIAGWTFLVALITIAGFAGAAMSRRDEPRLKPTI